MLHRLRSALRDDKTRTIVDALLRKPQKAGRLPSMLWVGACARPLGRDSRWTYTGWTREAGFGALWVMCLSRMPPLALVAPTAPHRHPKVTT